jgi:hypothetical protein
MKKNCTLKIFMLRRPLSDGFYHENKWFLDSPKIFSLFLVVENRRVTSVCDKRFQEMCILSLFIIRLQPLLLKRNYSILLHIYFCSKLPHEISLSPAILRNGISFKNYSRYLSSHQKTILEILYTVFSHGRMYRLRNIFHTFRLRVIAVLIALKRVFRKLESAGTRCVIFKIMEVKTGNHY